jgi:AcrR family transcriptional regulator
MKNVKGNPNENSLSKASAYHHGDLKQALVETGLGIIRKQGAHALSLRAAARKAGVSEAAPYRHFHNKEALLASIAEEGFNRLHQRMVEAIAAAQGDPLAELHAVTWEYAEFVLQETDHFRTMFSSSLTSSHAAKHPGLRKAALQCFEELVGVVRTCQKSHILARNVDAQATAGRLWGSIHGMSILLVDQYMVFLGATPEQTRAFVRQQVDSHLQGLRTFTSVQHSGKPKRA